MCVFVRLAVGFPVHSGGITFYGESARARARERESESASERESERERENERTRERERQVQRHEEAEKVTKNTCSEQEAPPP